MSIKEALHAALESDDVDDDVFAEELEVLEVEVPDAAEVFSDIVSVEADIGMLKLLEASVEGREITELDRGVYNQVRARYCMEAVSVESADSFQRQVVGFRMGLEAAVMASMEGFSDKIIWNDIDGIEKNSATLTTNLRRLKGDLNWFGDNALVIRASTDALFFSIDNKPSANIASDAVSTVKILTTLVDAAKDTLDTADRMLSDVHSAKIKSDADAKKLLDKISGYKNPLSGLTSSVVNKPLLHNWNIDQTTYVVNYGTGKLNNWTVIPEFTAKRMGTMHKVHGKGTSKLITVPTWLLFAATVGKDTGKAMAFGISRLGGPAILAGAVGAALVITTATLFKDLAKSAVGSFRDKHHVAPTDLISAFEKLQQSADALAAVRRSAKGKKGNVEQFTARAREACAAHKEGLDAEGKMAMDDVAKIIATAHRSGWSTMVNATRVTYTIMSGAANVSSKMVKQIDKK